jgi:hypothetical protein
MECWLRGTRLVLKSCWAQFLRWVGVYEHTGAYVVYIPPAQLLVRLSKAQTRAARTKLGMFPHLRSYANTDV